MKRILVGTVMVICYCLLAGCFSSSPPITTIRYYVIDYPIPTITGKSTVNAALRLEEVTASPLVNSPEMVWQVAPYTRDRKRYERWYAPPAEMVETLLLRDLTRVFPSLTILSRNEESEARFILTCHLTDFLAIERDQAFFACVGVTVILLDRAEQDRDKRWILRKSYDMEERISAPTPEEMARGMSIALSRLSAQILGDLERAIGTRLVL